MMYYYNGEINFNKDLTEEQQEYILDILEIEEACFSDDSTLDIDTDNEYHNIDSELNEIESYCKKQKIKILTTSGIKISGDADGGYLYYKDKGFKDVCPKTYYLWEASDDEIINEMKKRGIKMPA